MSNLSASNTFILFLALFVLFILSKKVEDAYNITMIYKVVELSVVTDEDIERALNQWTEKGYLFESIHFVTNQASRRPAMAFIFFIKKDENTGIAETA